VKRVLFDENMPRMLRRELAEFDVRTVQEEGWSSLQNGALLRKAETNFDILVTVDQRLPQQQNISSLRIAVIVVSAQSTRLIHLRPLLPKIKRAIAAAQPGEVVVVTAG
jgi:hypothetical protein